VPARDPAAAMAVARRIRTVLHDLPDGCPGQLAGTKVSASMGVATIGGRRNARRDPARRGPRVLRRQATRARHDRHGRRGLALQRTFTLSEPTPMDRWDRARVERSRSGRAYHRMMLVAGARRAGGPRPSSSSPSPSRLCRTRRHRPSRAARFRSPRAQASRPPPRLPASTGRSAPPRARPTMTSTWSGRATRWSRSPTASGRPVESLSYWNRARYPSLDPESSAYAPNRIEAGWRLGYIPGEVSTWRTCAGSGFDHARSQRRAVPGAPARRRCSYRTGPLRSRRFRNAFAPRGPSIRAACARPPGAPGTARRWERRGRSRCRRQVLHVDDLAGM